MKIIKIIFLTIAVLCIPQSHINCMQLRVTPERINNFHNCIRSNNIENVKNYLNNIPDLLEAKNEFGETELLIAVLSGNLPMTEFLISEGAKFDVITTDNDNIYHYAVFSNNSKLLSFLIEQYDVDFDYDLKHAINNNGLSPLELQECLYERALRNRETETAEAQIQILEVFNSLDFLSEDEDDESETESYIEDSNIQDENYYNPNNPYEAA